jgi:hypothetical protein
MRKLTSSLLLVAVTIFISPLASAATFTAVGQSVYVEYNGIVDGDEINDLSASTLYTLDSIGTDGQTWMFSGLLDNTGSIDSRISLAGFDSSEGIDIGGSSASGAFSTISSGTLPQGFNLDYCMKNVGGNNCAGGGGTGVLNGESLEFMFVIQLMAGVTELELSEFAVRYQSIAGVDQGTSGIGTATYIFFNEGDINIPLPASAWLFMSALGGLAAFKRKRKA